MKNCIVSFQDKDVVKELSGLGYNCIATIPSDKVSPQIATHADVLYLKIDDKNILISSCQCENIPILQGKGLCVNAIDSLKPGYQSECGLNVIKIQNTLIYNPKTAIKCDLFNNVTHKIPIKQGYTKCSTIVIDEKAYITEDKGVYNSMVKNGKDCLLLSKGSVRLDGYEYGFIGGAGIMLENRVLFFCGDVMQHPQKDNILQFLNKYDVAFHYIKNKPMVDVGGAIIF
ncbi:MAG: hypothetical protein RR827_06755 [Oscillospiraceae bacterium]